MWNTILQRTVVAAGNLEGQDVEAIGERIRSDWQQFVGLTLPAVEEALSAESWLWEASAP